MEATFTVVENSIISTHSVCNSEAEKKKFCFIYFPPCNQYLDSCHVVPGYEVGKGKEGNQKCNCCTWLAPESNWVSIPLRSASPLIERDQTCFFSLLWEGASVFPYLHRAVFSHVLWQTSYLMGNCYRKWVLPCLPTIAFLDASKEFLSLFLVIISALKSSQHATIWSSSITLSLLVPLLHFHTPLLEESSSCCLLVLPSSQTSYSPQSP